MKLSMKTMATAAMLVAAPVAMAKDWGVYGGDTGHTRYSVANQVNAGNVKSLQVKWALQLGTNRSQESTPILVGDTMFVTSSFGPKHVYAVNAKTGDVKWRHSPELPKNVDQSAWSQDDQRRSCH